MANATAFGLLVIVLVTAAVTDLRTGQIFNWLTYPAILIGIAFWTIVGFYQHGTPGAAAGAATRFSPCSPGSCRLRSSPCSAGSAGAMLN